MYLKRIEIAGFKSFAERTVIDFDRGLTAVVGPNGSGKSNITEAIRWVLGEQSAKSLRGGKMPDIIFAGTEKRKPLNIAEVTVVLDNEERFLPLDFSEVSVTRRLKRSGESDFFINKQSCRLKDIVDLFMDSGLGKESFSIISQGKVEAIFNSKPEDRRGIFEEAAGVLKYKQRKTQAERKLFETEDNLNRVQDIVYELEGQLEPLREQSETAKKYLQLKEQLTSVDVSVTVHEIDELKEQWEAKDAALKEIDQTISQVADSVANFERTLINLRDKRNNLDHKLDQDQQQLLTATEAYEQAEGHKNVLLERSQNTEKNTSEYQANLAALQTKIEQYEAERQGLISELKEKETSKLAIVATVSELETLVTKYSQSAKDRLADLRSEYVELMQSQASANNDLKHLEKQYEQESQKNKSAMGRHEQLVTKNTELETREEKAQTNLETHQAKLTEMQSAYLSLQQKTTTQKQELTTKEKQMYDAMGILQQAKARQKSLQELQENYAGFYQGVRAVLKAKSELSGVVGAVAELIEVPKSLALGIETALGAAAQNVVVADEAAGRSAIAYLKKKQMGRATFIPLSTVKERHIPADVVAGLKKVPGFVGIASEEVKFDHKVRAVISNLLGVTILAKDLASANQLAKEVRYKYRVVSLEGDVMNPGGSMTGGATRKGNQGNLFSQAGELQTLTEQVAKMEVELKEREVLVRQLKEAVQQADRQLEQLREQGETSRLKEQELKNQLELLGSERSQLARELKAFDHESQGLNSFLDNYKSQKAELEKALADLTEKRDQLDEEMSHADELEAVNAQKREATLVDLQKQQAVLAVAAEQESHLDQLISSKKAQRDEAQREADNLAEQLRLLTDDQSNHAMTQDEIETKMTTLQTTKVELQESLANLKIEREEVQTKITELDDQLTESNKRYQDLLGEKSQAEVIKSRSEVGMDNALQRLQEDYSLSYEAGKEQYPLTVEIGEGKLQIRGFKQEIDRLGPVNMGAIEQFESVNERYGFLTTQRDDLLEAKDSLFSTMNEMDEVVKEKFGEIFGEIREKFQETFPRMFGGGYADLQLTDPDDLLNTGIEIVAQPPGKKLQSLSLLSGGERALTAIALLFSIIQVRPVPFCVLDEVEAALDEANVARFGQYLSKFEDDTQFIVITHRKGTMEAADVLYGVTMQESGVSKIVSVRLEDINDRGDIAK
ncbi:chromosome segregation protein SMC [Vagococcus coleopterorum]|uniref:Chromosome partition protein Smc n=1 Tax=Vagococcus coleopterorum TaxID=2714946 RepID=A0A6G8AMD8_9ENTE|nr:chromosome segregation protein SMC [Vagococcus coleopterorum]QIL46166.1 chromosome segregation protein SMC [Vagococcus coleopterorum]